MYQVFHAVHLICVVLSLCGFVLRGLSLWPGWHVSPVWQQRARWWPHVIDSILLLSALAMLWLVDGVWLQHPWLQAKLLGLLAYIVLGSLALKRGRTLLRRRTAFVLALVVVAWMVSVAVSKSPLGWLAGMV